MAIDLSTADTSSAIYDQKLH